jgi:hypothetical protein
MKKPGRHTHKAMMHEEQCHVTLSKHAPKLRHTAAWAAPACAEISRTGVLRFIWKELMIMTGHGHVQTVTSCCPSKYAIKTFKVIRYLSPMKCWTWCTLEEEKT